MTEIARTLDRRVGFESLKLFMRYQMDFRILHMMRNIMISAAHKPSTVLKISAIKEAAEEDPSRDEARSSLPPTSPLVPLLTEGPGNGTATQGDR